MKTCYQSCFAPTLRSVQTYTVCTDFFCKQKVFFLRYHYNRPPLSANIFICAKVFVSFSPSVSPPLRYLVRWRSSSRQNISLIPSRQSRATLPSGKGFWLEFFRSVQPEKVFVCIIPLRRLRRHLSRRERLWCVSLRYPQERALGYNSPASCYRGKSLVQNSKARRRDYFIILPLWQKLL